MFHVSTVGFTHHVNKAIIHKPLNCFTYIYITLNIFINYYSFVQALCKYDNSVFQNNILKMHTIMIQCRINKNMYVQYQEARNKITKSITAWCSAEKT